MPKVSVIMPCLNMAEYMEPCMDSVIRQSLADIEILVIDAGSTDGTLEILERYAGADARIRIIHSDKKSYGYQMNRGIASASGEYIGIVETDDIIQPDMYEILYQKAVSEKADYVKGTSEGFYRGPNGTEWRFSIVPCRELSEKPEYILTPKDTPEVFLHDNFLWNGIYRREFIRKVKFQETPGAAFQDIGALFQIASRAERGVYLKHLVYNYRQDNSNASSFNKKSIMYTAAEYQYIEQFLDALSSEWHKVYYLKMAGLSTNRFHIMAASGEYWNESETGIDELRRKLQHAVDRRFVGEKACTSWQKQLWPELCMFLEKPLNLYEYLEKNYEKKRQTLQNMADMACRHKTIIFGAGRTGQFVHMYLMLQGIETVMAYCDNSKLMQGKTLRTAAVWPPAEAVRQAPDAYYIIAAGKHSEEMKIQLTQLGVEADFISIYQEGTDISLLRDSRLQAGD